jgi:hypothetical protein
MSLTDSMKQQAGQAWGTVQQGLGQGHAKFDELRANRQAQSLLRNLGAAYYAREREGGSEEAVTAAVEAMDRHLAAHRPHETAADDAGSTSKGETSELDSGTPTSPES